MLLERKEVNPDRPDKWGQTPLSCAALCGTEGVVKVLLGREEVNPDKPDNDGQTPLSIATKEGQTALQPVIKNRFQRVVTLLGLRQLDIMLSRLENSVT